MTWVTTFSAFSLATYLDSVDLVAATTDYAPRLAAASGEFRRSYEGLPANVFAGATAVSDEAPIVVGVDRPAEQALVNQIAEFRGLGEGWDGEFAARPSPLAIRDAIKFIRASPLLPATLEPSLHVDGSVILELEDGVKGSLRFRGDGQIICALPSMAPASIAFNGLTVPAQLQGALESAARPARKAA